MEDKTITNLTDIIHDIITESDYNVEYEMDGHKSVSAWLSTIPEKALFEVVSEVVFQYCIHKELSDDKAKIEAENFIACQAISEVLENERSST